MKSFTGTRLMRSESLATAARVQHTGTARLGFSHLSHTGKYPSKNCSPSALHVHHGLLIDLVGNFDLGRQWGASRFNKHIQNQC